MDATVWQKFDAAAYAYDQSSRLQQQSAQYLLSLMGSVRADSVWLDAGCGTGVLAKALAAQNARVWAIDLAPNMLKVLEDNDQIQTILADISQLPLADDMLDGAVSNFALHWLGTEIITEIMRVVQPSGSAWLAIPVLGSLSEITARYPEFPVFKFEAVETWLNEATPWLQHYEIQRFSQQHPHLKSLITAIRQMGGDHTGQAHSRHDLSLWKQWLQDPAPIALSFDVLFLHLKKPADSALSFLYQS